MSDVSQMVKQVREANNLSQDELAQLMDVSVSAVYGWERGAWGMTNKNLESFMKLFPNAKALLTQIGAKVQPMPNTENKPYSPVPQAISHLVVSRLHYARKKAGIHVTDAAREIGMPPNRYQGMENNQVDISYEQVMTLCNLFDISACWVLTGIECERCNDEPELVVLGDTDKDMAHTILDLIDLDQFDGTTKKALQFAKSLLNGHGS